jgi:CRP-like cAMP-binding protein
MTPRQVVVEGGPRVRRSAARASKSVENAVYSYMRAVRTLGRTKITTDEVADALALSVREVNSALSSLKKKGVRALNG